MMVFVRCSSCSSTASNRCCTLDQPDSDGARGGAIFALGIRFLPFFSVSVVSVLSIFIRQMNIGLDGCHNAGVPQSLLHKLPIHRFAVLEGGTNQICGMDVA